MRQYSIGMFAMALVIQNRLGLKEYEAMSSSEGTFCLMKKTLPAPLRNAYMETYVFPTHSRYGNGPRQVFCSIAPSELYLDNISKSETGRLSAVNRYIDLLSSDRVLSGFGFDVDGPDHYPRLRILDPEGREVSTVRIDDIDGFIISVKRIGADSAQNGAMLLEGKVQLSLVLFQNALSFFAEQMPEIAKFIRSNPIFEVKMETLRANTSLADPLLIAQLEDAIPWDSKMLNALGSEMRGTQKLSHKQISSPVMIGLLFLRDGNVTKALDMLETKVLQVIEPDSSKQDLFSNTMSEAVIELTSLLRDPKSEKLGIIEEARKKAADIIKSIYG